MSACDPWSDRAALAEAASACRATRERLLERLSARLASIHGVDLGTRYWRIVLGPWLLYHLQQLEDRRRRAAAGGPGTALAEADFQVPRDTVEFLGLFQTERYNLQIHTLALRAAGATATEIRMGVPVLPGLNKPSGARALFHAARRAFYTSARCLWPADILTDGLYPLGRRHELLTKALDFRLFPLGAELPEGLRVPAVLDGRRRALADLPSEGALEALAVSSLPWCMPALFLEGFPAARAHARRVLGRPPKLMLHSVGVYYDELYKLCAAEASLAGTRLVGVQHGGQYGTAAWSNPEWHERSVADAYLTWGWSEDPGTTPAPMPWLSYPPARAPRPGEILLVSTSGLREAHELFPAPMGEQWREFFAWRGRFLDALGPEDLAAARLRLFPKDYGWDERPEAARRWPALRVDAGGSFDDSLARAALVVTDHPGTTFFETLAWDFPGVHFWEDRLWESRPAAEAALAPLRRAGIVHGSPESAARKAAEVRYDPRNWWNGTRAARLEFTRLYARADPAWPAAWAALLRGEIERAGTGRI